MEMIILVKSSSQPEPRSVTVTRDESGLSFICDCPAGNRGRICKHKKALASRDDSMLFNEYQMEKFEQLVDWVTQSGYPDLMDELKEAEIKLQSARDRASDIKEKIARVMNEGLK